MHTKNIFRFYGIVPLYFILFLVYFVLLYRIIKGDMGRFESIGSEGILEKLKRVLNSMEYKVISYLVWYEEYILGKVVINNIS